MTMKTSSIAHKSSTLFLRLTAMTVAIAVAALCAFLLPDIAKSAEAEYPGYGYAAQLIVAAMYLAAVPFFFGIFKGWKVLDAIDAGRVFSKRVVSLLKSIASYAGFISIVFAFTLPLFYVWADNDDAPGLMVIGLFLVGMPLIISAAIGLIARLLHEAVTIKSENDLTV